MTRGTQELWATFAVAFVGITWGCWWIFLRLIEARGISPGWTLATVYGAAGLILLPLFAYRWRHWRALAWSVIAVGVAYGLPLAFWSHAVIHGNVVRVTLLFYLTPVWGTLVAVTAFRERLTPLRLLAVIFGLIGAAAVLVWSRDSRSRGRRRNGWRCWPARCLPWRPRRRGNGRMSPATTPAT